MVFQLNIFLLALLVFCVESAPLEQSLTIDEKLALAGSNGVRNSSAEISADGKSVRVELDVVKVTPIKQKGHVRPPHAGKSRNTRSAAQNTELYWPGGVIPYVITSVFSNEERRQIRAAIEEFNKYTCVRFVARTNEASYLSMIKDGGCWSYVGKSFAGKQELSLSEGCVFTDVIVHELMHAAGVHHEHQRKDRDTKIEVVRRNIQGGNEDQFNIETDTNDYSIPYDYRSVMHYGKTAFSANGLNTIRTREPQFQDVIGRAPTLGFFDIKLITTMYKCNEKCSSGIQCPSNGFLAHDCTCYCSADSINKNPPVLQCGGGGAGACQTLDSPCSCDTSVNTACSGLSNSVCNSVTGACECEAGFTTYQGACVDPSTITCSTLGEAECRCELNADSACQSLLHSECDTSTGKCLCKDGYVALEGKCVLPAAIVCDTVGEPCQCSSKNAPACDSLDNTECNMDTEACDCVEGYYNIDGVCNQPPTCSVLNINCYCHLQDSGACSSLENAACNIRTGACECRIGYTLQSEDNSCIADPAAEGLILVNDGSAISPLVNSAVDTGDWVVATGSDSADNGVMSNNEFLSASSDDLADYFILETNELPAGIYCVAFAIDLVHASLYINTEFSAESEGITFLPGNSAGLFIPESARIRITEPDKILFMAESYDSDTWQVRLDAIRIELCGETENYQTTDSYYYYY